MSASLEDMTLGGGYKLEMTLEQQKQALCFLENEFLCDVKQHRASSVNTWRIIAFNHYQTSHTGNGGVSTTSMMHTRNPTRNQNPNPYNLPGEGAISEALPTPVTPRPRTVLGSLLPVLRGDPRDGDPLGTDSSALSHPGCIAHGGGELQLR